MKNWFATLITLALVVVVGPACAWMLKGGNDGTPNSIYISANLASPSSVIPNDFVGFSFETSKLISTNGFGAASPLIPVINLLGANGTIRIGGLSSDSNPVPALTQSIANNLKSFTDGLGVGWSLIYTLDFSINNSAAAVTQAGYIINAYGVGNVQFQLGNEPNNYLSAVNYRTRWNDYYSALSTAYPTIRMSGPDADTESAVQSYTTGLTLSSAQLNRVTSHFYSTGPAPVAGLTAQSMLAFVASENWSLNAAYAPGQLQNSESNTVWNGGQDGLSNRLVAATWFIYTFQKMIAAGWEAINIHTTDNGCNYCAFALQGGGGELPMPIFYGMYMVAQIQGQTEVSTTNGNAGIVPAISTQRAVGKANILVTNISANQVYIKPDQSSAWSTASVILLSGTSCTDANPTLGGQVIGEGGSWSGVPFTINSGDLVSIPACGAALVQIQ